MTGNVENAAVWAFGDVFIGPEDATVPEDGADWGVEWEAVGLLDGSAGFVQKAAMQSKDFYAWGSVLVATSRNQYKLTVDFTVLELDNPTVMSLFHDTSGVTFNDDGTYSGDLGIPDLKRRFKIGFQTKTGDTMRRLVSRNYAEIETRGDQKDGEDDLSMSMVTVTIYPTSDRELFHAFKGAAVAVGGSSGGGSGAPGAQSVSFFGDEAGHANAATVAHNGTVQLETEVTLTDGTVEDWSEHAGVSYAVVSLDQNVSVDHASGLVTGLVAGSQSTVRVTVTRSAGPALTADATITVSA